MIPREYFFAAANATSDPIAALAKSQGWYDSTGATTAATQALNTAKSNGTTTASVFQLS